MPSGPIHDLLTVTTAAAAVPWVVGLPEMNVINYVCLMGGYLGSNYLFSNDLDLHSESYDRWGPLRFIWYPYQRVIHHRSWASHGIGIGPLLRVVYFAAAMFILLYGLFSILDWLGATINKGGVLDSWSQSIYGFFIGNPLPTIYFLIGFVLSGALHTVADLLNTWRKRHL